MAAAPCLRRGCGEYYATVETCIQTKGSILVSVRFPRPIAAADCDRDDADTNDVSYVNDDSDANGGAYVNDGTDDDEEDARTQTSHGYNDTRSLCDDNYDDGFDDYDDDDDTDDVIRVFLSRVLFMRVVQLHYGSYRGGDVPNLPEPLKSALRFNVSEDKKGVTSQVSLMRRDNTLLYAQLASMYKGLTYLTYSEGGQSKTIPLCHSDNAYQLCQELMNNNYVTVLLHHHSKVNMRGSVGKYAMDKWKEWRPCKVKSRTTPKRKPKTIKQKEPRETEESVVASTPGQSDYSADKSDDQPDCTVPTFDTQTNHKRRKSAVPKRYNAKQISDKVLECDSDGDSDDSNIVLHELRNMASCEERDVLDKPWKPKMFPDKTGLTTSNNTSHPYIKPKSVSRPAKLPVDLTHQDSQMHAFAQLDKSIEDYRCHREGDGVVVGGTKCMSFFQNR